MAVIKRMLDIFLATVGMLLTLPLLPAIALFVKLDSKGPIFYPCERVGKDRKLFKMYKFRTMVEIPAQVGTSLSPRGDVRVTDFGRFLRKTKLNEPPQLINILKGEMSIVGPRPPLPDEVALYEDWHKYRIEGWVGLTGLWQICGRNRLQFEEVVLFDVFYLHNFSLSLDLQIILLTVNVVLSPKGSY